LITDLILHNFFYLVLGPDLWTNGRDWAGPNRRPNKKNSWTVDQTEFSRSRLVITGLQFGPVSDRIMSTPNNHPSYDHVKSFGYL